MANAVLQRARGTLVRTVPSNLCASSLDAVFLPLLALVGGYVYYRNLGASEFFAPDEATYANGALNILTDGYWLFPHMNFFEDYAAYGPFLEKPPGLMWLEAASMSFIGINEFAARLPSATFAILCGLLAYYIGRDMFDEYAGLVAGFVWLTTPYLFTGLNGGRMAATDTTHVFFGSLFVYFVWKSVDTDDQWYFIPMGFAAAADLYIKGFAAGVFLLVVAPLVAANLRSFYTRKFLAGSVITILLVMPWTTLGWLRYGQRFVNELFWEQVVGRSTGQLADVGGGFFGFMNYPYIQRLPTFFNPWIYFLIPAVTVAFLATVHGTDRDTRNSQFLSWWIASVFGFFTLTGNHAWYIMPIYLPAGVLIGRMVTLAVRGDRLPVVGVAAGAGLTLASVFLTDLTGGASFGVLVIGTSLLVILFGSIRGRTSPDTTGRRYVFGAHAVPALLALSLIASMAIPPPMGALTDNEFKEFGKEIDEDVPRAETIFIERDVTAEQLSRSFEFVTFYAQRPFRLRTMEQLNTDENVSYALMTQNRTSHLYRKHTVVAVMNRSGGERYVLVNLSSVQRPDNTTADSPAVTDRSAIGLGDISHLPLNPGRVRSAFGFTLPT